MTLNELEKFDAFSKPLIGLTLSHLWRGYGSAIFLEFGELTPRIRRNGSAGNPKGQMTLGIEWSWRVEGKRRIWCGSWSEEEVCARAFNSAIGATAQKIAMVGRIGEIDLQLSNGLHFLSFMTERGDPEWSLSNLGGVAAEVVAGRLHFDTRDYLRRLENGHA